MKSLYSSRLPAKRDSRKAHFLHRYWRTLGVYLFLVPMGMLFLLPFYILLRNALLNQLQISSFTWIWLPIPFSLESWTDLFTNDTASMVSGLLNSTIVAVCQSVGQLLFASMAGYGLARLPVRGKNIIFYAILITLMIPGAVTFVPTYLIVSYLGWVNTLQGIIVPGLFSAFSTLLFRQFYLDFPQELEDAGRIDGLSRWGLYWHLLLPNSRNIILSLGLLAFVSSWNSFLWPLVIGQDSSLWTVQVVLSSFLTEQAINLPALFMGAVVAIVPLLLIFFLLQNYIVEGVARSGIKD